MSSKRENLNTGKGAELKLSTAKPSRVTKKETAKRRHEQWQIATNVHFLDELEMNPAIFNEIYFEYRERFSLANNTKDFNFRSAVISSLNHHCRPRTVEFAFDNLDNHRLTWPVYHYRRLCGPSMAFEKAYFVESLGFSPTQSSLASVQDLVNGFVSRVDWHGIKDKLAAYAMELDTKISRYFHEPKPWWQQKYEITYVKQFHELFNLVDVLVPDFMSKIKAAFEDNLGQTFSLVETGKVKLRKVNGDVLAMAAIAGECLKSFLCSEEILCSHFQPSTCPVCQKTFHSDTTSEDWFESQICPLCLGATQLGSGLNYLRKALPFSKLKALSVYAMRKFISIYGFVPNQDFSRYKRPSAFYTKLETDEDFGNLGLAFSLLPFLWIPNESDKYFESWGHMLNDTGVLVGTRTSQGGYRSIAKDGHLCLSNGERIICEHLTAKAIAHTKEPLYPKHAKLNKNMLLRADFLINGTYVEYAGRMSNNEYATKIENKKLLAESLKLRLVVIEPRDLKNLDQVMGSIFFGGVTPVV